LAAQIQQGERKTLKGDIQELGGEYGVPGEFEVSANFLRSKLAPVVAYAVNAIEGENVIGQKFDPAEDTLRLFAPLFLADLADAYVEEGLEGFVRTLPAGLGLSTDTFDVNKPIDPKEEPNDFESGFEG